jgi:hypothetical protein
MMAVDATPGAAELPQVVALSGDNLLLKAQASDAAAAVHEEAAVALADVVGAFNDDDAGRERLALKPPLLPRMPLMERVCGRGGQP